MKIVSLNIRGWGGSAKRRRLGSFLQKGAFDVCLLQETKKSSFEDHLIHNLWGHKDVRWVVQEPVGLSGGMLIIWNSDSFKFLSSFSGNGFLGITVERESVVLHIVNIYSPCNISGKKKLWEDILALKQHSSNGEWCVGGDFNAVLHSSERIGSSAVSRQGERILFNRFVEELEVIDVPVLGKKFSWFSADGRSMSRIDRFLLSDGFITTQGISSQWIGDRDISDHCPIWLMASPNNWGPKPFRVINGWLEHPEFLSFVENSWKGFEVHGKKAYVLKEKFKLLKNCLKSWNKEVFGFLDLNIEKTVKELNDIEGLLGGDDEDLELTRREGLSKEFWRQLHLKESLLKQKSRMRWVKEGDSNSRYFHESIKSRRKRNQLVALKDGDQWIQGVEEVKGFVKDYFENNFRERWEWRPNLNGIHFQSLSAEDNILLMAPFSLEEVREVIWCSDGNKCPGPDGFNFNFLKACWDIIKGDIMEFLSEFHGNAFLPKAITASFLTLIPKKDHPQALSDYRPICLVSSLYKILAKVLATRLKKVLGKLISKVQSAFLPNRQILDGVLVVNELLDLAKRRKDKCLFFKVDFERAYDTVNWNFLDYMMVRMGFAEGWRRWIRACVFQSSMSVLVNGSPTEDFSVCKGLRQGDPLSPFLFLIVAEGLSGLMSKAVDNNRFHGYKVSNNILFHTLQFADDTIIVGEGNWDNLWCIKTVLRSFEIVSGLKVNFYKSKLYGINLDESFLRASSAFLNCGVETIPFRFLGIPVGANPRRRATWLPIFDSMKKRLNAWNGRHLSIGGRVTLINSVLSSLPLYFFSFYKAPVCVLKDLVSIQRNFLWGGGMDSNKMCWVSWESICQSKDKGGLGIKNLELFNASLLCKWKWRCLNDREAPWNDFLRWRYGSFAANFLYGEGRAGLKQASIWWRDIWKLGSEEEGSWFGNNISSILGDGNDIGFWKEKWIGATPLRELFPALYNKSLQQDSRISSMGAWDCNNWV
ncbi:cysteine-rich receptor-like protein kinase, partial [Trifolium pratense]